MRHGVKKPRLGRPAAHRKAMLNNLASSILTRGIAEEQSDRHVITTVEKAKAVKPLVDRLVTYAKKGDLTSRRQAARFVKQDKRSKNDTTLERNPKVNLLQELFNTIGPRYAERPGGYTRVLKLEKRRKGDNAQLAIISLVEDEILQKPKKKRPKKSAKPKKMDITQSEEVEKETVPPVEVDTSDSQAKAEEGSAKNANPSSEAAGEETQASSETGGDAAETSSDKKQ